MKTEWKLSDEIHSNVTGILECHFSPRLEILNQLAFLAT